MFLVSKRSQSGFTLIELLVVIVIVGILLMLAAPSFARILRSTSVSGAVNAFLADARLARVEGIRRGGHVILCRSDDPEVANPVCGTGAGGNGRGWATGWIIFQDIDGSGNRNDDEPILQIHGAVVGVESIDDGALARKLIFGPTGRLVNPADAVALVFGGSNFVVEDKRVICVGASGRARSVGNGLLSCQGDV
jgi:type IV fimbrial biogenesis protein FimT